MRTLLLDLAREEGFDLAGIAPVEPSAHGGFLRRWVGEGRHGEMAYLARGDALERRDDPELSLPGARSALVVGHSYFQADPPGVPREPSRGVIARYARGRDYHRVVKKGLLRVHRRLEEELGRPVEGRAYVDTGPVLERELAQKAGLGWFGRNTMLIHPRKGSYFFLGVLLLTEEAEPDEPFQADHCGTCRACLDACPTGALLGRTEEGAPLMDARLCISYLTIEHRGPIPRELRPLIGNRVYGCDICQEVCPFNVRFAEPATDPGYAARGPGERPVGVEASGPAGPGSESGTTGGALAKGGVCLRRALRGSAETPGGEGHRRGPAGPPSEAPRSLAPLPPDPHFALPLHPGTDAPSLVELLRMALSEEGWEAFSRGSAIRRAGRAGFARNVCVALGNWLAGDSDPPPEAVAVLVEALSDPEPLVRGHAAWALGQVELPGAVAALEERGTIEPDEWVAEEIQSALDPAKATS